MYWGAHCGWPRYCASLQPYLRRRPVQTDPAQAHFLPPDRDRPRGTEARQVDKAVLQAEQLQIAGGTVECISAVAGVHANGHIIVAVLVGNIHRKDSLAGCKVENDVLPHTRGQILHIAVDIARCGGELHDRCVTQIVSGPDALHLVAAVGFHGVHALDAGGDHGIALHQPVLVINVGVALDRRIVVGVGKACVARAEPVADNRADRARAVIVDDCRVFDCHLIASGRSSSTGVFATTSPVFMSSARRFTGSALSVNITRFGVSVGEQPPPHARPPPVVLSPSPLTFAPTLSYGVHQTARHRCWRAADSNSYWSE